MTRLIFGAVEDYSLGASITAGSSASPSLAASNLLNQYAADLWQSAGLGLHETELMIDLGTSHQVATVGLAASNASSSGRMRVRMSEAPIVQTREVPEGTPQSFGCVGTTSDIDDSPLAPDANAIVSVRSDPPVSTRFVLTDPSADLIPGPDLQIFRARLQAPATDDGLLEAIDLFDNNDLIRPLLEKPVKIPAGEDQIIYTCWDVDEIAAPSRAGAKVAWSGGVPGQGEVRLRAFDWLPYAVTSGVAASPWVRAYPEDLAGSLAGRHPREVVSLSGHTAWTYQEGGAYAHTAARYLKIEIDDRANPDGFVQAGRCPVGPSIFLPRNRPGLKVETVRVDNVPRRRLTLPLELLTRAETAQVLTYFGMGHEEPGCFVIPSPERAGKTLLELPFWGMLEDSHSMTHRSASIDLWDGQLVVTEDL